MKKISSKKVVETVKEFQAIKKQMSEMEATMKELRASLKEALGDESSALVGEFLVLVSERTRKDVDKDALQKELGDAFDKFLKVSSYEILEVKKA
jgi:predicted phage-related endonuclease